MCYMGEHFLLFHYHATDMECFNDVTLTLFLLPWSPGEQLELAVLLALLSLRLLLTLSFKSN